MKTCPLCGAAYANDHSRCAKDGAMLVVSMELEPGRVISGKYRIVRLLGRGGMGTVYLADHILLGRQRALKFISNELSQSPRFLARFRREAQAAIELRHPNVIEVVDLDQAEDGSPYIAMEYVDGMDLRDALRAGAFPVDRALIVARGLALGLGAAHAKGIVHRDLKPENILLAFGDGKAETPKLLDFGIAAVKEISTELSLTRGLILSPMYAAPEQWSGMASAKLDGRVDIYALGGVLYEMLTGQTVFRSHNSAGWMQQHLHEEPHPPSRQRPELANWPGLDALVLRLLAKDREQRPRDAAKVVEMLDGVRSVDPQVRQAKAGEQLRSIAAEKGRRRDLRRVPRLAWILSAIFLALSIILSGLAFSFSPAMISRRADILDNGHHYSFGSILRRLGCIRGSGESCGLLADMYENGEGVEQDFALASRLYLRAASFFTLECNRGSADSCRALARIYQGGNGVEKDTSRADELNTLAAEFDARSCDAGNGKVCGELGLSYSVGGEVPQDRVKAAEFLTKACSLGEAYRGCVPLGTAYKFGWGVPKSIEQASEFYDKGCDLGEPSGCREAGDLYGWGLNAPQDFARAAGLYSRACNAGDDLGCDELGDLYRDGNGVPRDAEKAKYYYSKACSSSSNLHFGCDELRKLE